jgi:hypothetical protein
MNSGSSCLRGLRSPVEIVCPKNRRFPKGTVPKLKDFRHEKFLSIAPGYAFGYEQANAERQAVNGERLTVKSGKTNAQN